MTLRLTEMSSLSNRRKIARVLATTLFVTPALIVYTLANAASPPVAPVAPRPRAPAPTVAPILPRIDAGSTTGTQCTITLSGKGAVSPITCVATVSFDGTNSVVSFSGVSSDPAHASQLIFLSSFAGEPVKQQQYTQSTTQMQSASYANPTPKSTPVWVMSQGSSGTPNQGTASCTFTSVVMSAQVGNSTKIYTTHGRVDAVLVPQTTTGAAGSVTATILF